ncbi:MAG: hypothetical protein MJZ23_05270 [Paludibacteraceae bacterium]|nr:hypothetical protein [Paludibacteraceae bacterium]
MKYLTVTIIGAFVILYFFVFTGERRIFHYSNSQCSLTRVEYDNWFDTWVDLYYGKLDYDDIDKNKSFIRCEIRGGFNGNMNGLIQLREDSIILFANEGAFYQCNCSDSNFFLMVDDGTVDHSECLYYTYGFCTTDIEDADKLGVKLEVLPSQHTFKYFNTVNEKDACAYYDSSKKMKSVKYKNSDF